MAASKLGPVHNAQEEFKNWALFLRWVLPSTLIRRNCPPKTELLENALENEALRFSVDGKHFEKLFRNDDVTIIRWFVCPSLPQTQISNGGRNGGWFRHVGSTKTLLCARSSVSAACGPACDIFVFKFLWRCVDGKHFIRFLVWTKNSWCVFRVKLFLRSVDGALVWQHKL